MPGDASDVYGNGGDNREAEMSETTVPTWTEPQFLQKVTTVVPSIIYVFNQRSQSNEYSNRNLAEAIGYSAQEVQAMGDSLMPQLCHPDDLVKIQNHFERIQALDDDETLQVEYRMRHRDGHYVWLLSVDTVFDRGPDGEVVRHIGTATDISAIKHVAAALEAANEELGQRANDLQRTNENLEVVTYAATHDLKGPVNNINALVDILEADGHLAEPDAAAMANMIRTSCDQAGQKIAAIVKAAEARSESLVPEVVPLGPALDRVWQTHRMAVGDEAAIEIDLSGCETVMFSPFHVESILSNLLGNALKYRHPDRRPSVKVRTWRQGENAFLSVTDNGLGLDLPNDIDRVFGLFKRVHTEVPGSGIGLYTVREALLRTNGSIAVESVEGEGSVFEIDFGPGSAY